MLWIVPLALALGTTLVGCGGGESVAVNGCVEGATEELSCDDGQGVQVRRCESDRWIAHACQPLSNLCTDGVEQRTACEEGGSKIERCQHGAWLLDRDCGADCSPGSEESEDCGLNGQGARTNTCGADGQWQSGSCNDPDVCENGLEQSVTCEQFGTQEQLCEDGQWVDEGRCIVECQEGQRSTRACGFNDRGEQAVLCVEGTWAGDGACADPDVCTDDELNLLPCTGGFGRREQACVFGQWTESDCLDHSLSGSTAAGSTTTLGFCALDHQGRAHCWGNNNRGQLGLGHKNSAAGIQRPLAAERFIDIAYGSQHACGVTTEQTVLCWGANTSGQLGSGGTLDSLTPVEVLGVTGAVAVALGEAHSCALLADGPIQCWGNNEHGQLGNDSTVNAQSAQAVLNLQNAAQIVAGGHTTCAIDTTGQLYCWGDNQHGQLGIGSKVMKRVPTALSTLDSVTSVSVSQRHACAVHNRRTYCWGSNLRGGLGDGTFDAQLKPKTNKVIQSARAVAVGDLMGCALLEDGGITCWGDNYSGELGRGSTNTSGVGDPNPQRIGNFSDNVALAISNSQGILPLNTVCALKKDGKLFCWGARTLDSLPPPATGTAVSSPLAIPLP